MRPHMKYKRLPGGRDFMQELGEILVTGITKLLFQWPHFTTSLRFIVAHHFTEATTL